MPLYEYECTACQRRVEKIQKFSDPEITECPHCGGRLERVLSAPAVSFKGGGWYKDLYSSAKPANGAGGSSSAESGTARSAETSAPAAAAAVPAAAAPSGSSGSSESKS